MAILSDRSIRQEVTEHDMISPFIDGQIRYDDNQERIISYGLSSYGYDARVGNEFKIFTNVNSSIVDPKKFDDNSFHYKKTDVCTIPPNSFVLASTVEYFKIPKDVLVVCVGRSALRYQQCNN